MKKFLSQLPQLGLMPRRVAVDPQADEILWAESVWRPGGRRLRACGRVPRREDEKPQELIRRVAAERRLRRAEVSLAIRHPDMELARLELPAMPARDARRVGERRAREHADRIALAASWGYLLPAGKHARPVWLVACPEEFAGFAEQRWRSQGLPVAHFGSAHLALGSLAQVLDPPASGQLRAILDISASHAICVLADAEGWVFSREISIKLARVAQRDGEGAGPGGPGGSGGSAERLATELRRTFHYASGELRAGEVHELLLSGTRGGLDELARSLAEHLDLDVRLISDAMQDGPAAAADTALATVVGLALEPNVGAANLLPAASKRTLAAGQARRRLVAAALVPSLLLLFGGALAGGRIATLGERAEALTAEWEKSRAERDETEARAREWQRVESVARVLDATAPEQPPWSAVLRSLGLLIPDEAFVSYLAASRDSEGWLAELRIEFRGDDLAAAARAGSDFAEVLDASPLWQVRKVSPEKAPPVLGIADRGADRVRALFRLEAQLAPLAQAGDDSHG